MSVNHGIAVGSVLVQAGHYQVPWVGVYSAGGQRVHKNTMIFSPLLVSN